MGMGNTGITTLQTTHIIKTDYYLKPYYDRMGLIICGLVSHLCFADFGIKLCVLIKSCPGRAHRTDHTTWATGAGNVQI